MSISEKIPLLVLKTSWGGNRETDANTWCHPKASMEVTTRGRVWGTAEGRSVGCGDTREGGRSQTGLASRMMGLFTEFREERA